MERFSILTAISGTKIKVQHLDSIRIQNDVRCRQVRSESEDNSSRWMFHTTLFPSLGGSINGSCDEFHRFFQRPRRRFLPAFCPHKTEPEFTGGDFILVPGLSAEPYKRSTADGFHTSAKVDHDPKEKKFNPTDIGRRQGNAKRLSLAKKSETVFQ